jgi:hypothetical protein
VVHGGAFARFPPILPYAERPDQQKALVPLSEVFPGQLGRVAPIQVLVLPGVTNNSSTQVRPASKGEALVALAPKSLILLPSSGARGLDKLARLAERVPSYWLELGSDLSGVPDRVEELLARHSQ